jgi:hypothetical protein
VLILQRPWTEQPQTAVPAMPAVPKTVFHLFGSGWKDRDLITSQETTVTGTPIVGPSGLVTSSGNYLTGSATRTRFTGSRLTVICRIRIDVASTGTYSVVGTSGDQFLRMLLNINTVAPSINCHGYVYISGSYRGFAEATLARTPVVGEIYTIGIRFNQPSSQSFIRRGDYGPFTYSAAQSYNAVIADSGASLLFGTNNGNTQPFSGATSYVLAEETYWSNTELAELVDLPASRLQPGRIFIPYAAAAGGLPTLSAATYVPGSLTSTGFRPRVTATY